MPEFPTASVWPCPLAAIGTVSPQFQQAAELSWIINGALTTSGTWITANTAIYVPISIGEIVTVYQMSIQVTTQSGNCDVGIYDEQGNRLVSAGSTPVAAAGLQLFNITDTVLHPGTYYFAMNCDNTTASFFRSGQNVLQTDQARVRQQAVGAVTLPATASFTNSSQSYYPVLMAHLNATV